MLKLNNLKKTYVMGNTEIHALNGIDLEIKKNEFVAIMGASGSGKSTLMNILGCLDTPTSGTFLLNGEYVNTMDDDQLAEIRNSNLGFVFQNFNLLPRLTSLKNVALPILYSDENYEKSEEKAEEALKLVGLEDRMNHKSSELSGGQRQRVAIARALINNPAIILADEPTGNLDSKTSKEIMDLFCNLHRKGQTIVMVTHEPDIANYAERTITMKDGKILNEK